MRISDWSSDVCSSDLATRAAVVGLESGGVGRQLPLIDGHGLAARQERRFERLAVARYLDRQFHVGMPHRAFGAVRIIESVAVAQSRLGRFGAGAQILDDLQRSEEHTSELQSLMRN